MSVLKNKRTLSKAEFINVGHQVYIETLNFLTRLSARYSRILAQPIARLAGEVIDNAEKANSIFPSNPLRSELRLKHLLEARASLMALDARLSDCYVVMNTNPQGCFNTAKGMPVAAKDATRKLDKMAQKLGDLIDHENDLLKGTIKAVSSAEKKKEE